MRITESYIKSKLDGSFMAMTDDGFQLVEVPVDYAPEHSFRAFAEETRAAVREARMARVKPWTPADDRLLMDMRQSGETWARIRQVMRRGQQSLVERYGILLERAAAAYGGRARESILTLQEAGPPESMGKQILATVAEATGVSPRLMCGETRRVAVVRARFIAAYALIYVRGASYSATGRLLKRDHSSIIHAVRTVAENRAAYEPELSVVMQQFVDKEAA